MHAAVSASEYTSIDSRIFSMLAAMLAAAAQQLASYQHVKFRLGHTVYKCRKFENNFVVALWLLVGQVIIV
jgi:hypothetical protein